MQIAVQNPLVSERLELAVLYKEYAEDDHIYQQKIKVGTSVELGAAVGHQYGTGSLKGHRVPPGCPSLPQDLLQKYSYIRKTRPDGNCFYRAFGFAHLEALLEDGQELQRCARPGVPPQTPGYPPPPTPLGPSWSPQVPHPDTHVPPRVAPPKPCGPPCSLTPPRDAWVPPGHQGVSPTSPLDPSCHPP